MQVGSKDTLLPPAAENMPPDDTFPAQCQEDLDALVGYLHKINVDSLKPLKPVLQVRKVLLTGASGFLGRCLVEQLIRTYEDKSDKIHVYCLIQADNEEHGIMQMRKALQDAELWGDDLAPCIHVLPANLHEDRFGLGDEQWKMLLSEMDAVYHLSAGLQLAAPYETIRLSNTASFQRVLEVCTTWRMKHLFYASTMAIFPQYFCHFGGEFAGMPIIQDGHPEVALMKRHFPPWVMGYPWATVVAERVTLEAGRLIGIGVACFRIPEANIHSKTGYTEPEDAATLMQQAILQVRMSPPGAMRAMATNPIDSVVDLMCKITLNPERKNQIYHVVNPHVQYIRTEPWPAWFALTGHCVREVAYQEFKAAHEAIGDASAITEFWPLLDHFEEYWFTAVNEHTGRSWPISVGTVIEDTPNHPGWPDPLEMVGTSWGWIHRHTDLWPYDTKWMNVVHLPELHIQEAVQLIFKYELDHKVVLPAHAREGWQRLILDMESQNRPFFCAPGLFIQMHHNMSSRIQLFRFLKHFPEIKEELIEKPVFVIGLNRTGTTFLHRLIDATGVFQSPRGYDQIVVLKEELDVTAPDFNEERRLLWREMMGVVEREWVAKGVHDLGDDEPEEDWGPFDMAFNSLSYDVLHDLPDYVAWLDQQPLTEVYAEHKLWVQFLQWVRRKRAQAAGKDPDEVLTLARRRWVFKMPFHLRTLPALMRTYPDAAFVHTHRDLQKVVPSWCHLVQVAREAAKTCPLPLDLTHVGSVHLRILADMLQRSCVFREGRPDLAPRICDVQYNDLVANPKRTVYAILRHLGVALDEGVRDHLAVYLQKVESQRKEKKVSSCPASLCRQSASQHSADMQLRDAMCRQR